MFLETLAKYVVKHVQTDPSELCFVFPNRRSGLFFKRFLVKHTTRTSWAPRIITINELMEELGGLQVADPLDIIFELYDIYKEIAVRPEPFDSFYPWGEMMISDFDTLDKYLVDPDTVFRNIRELNTGKRDFSIYMEIAAETLPCPDTSAERTGGRIRGDDLPKGSSVGYGGTGQQA
jgi:hypothetical protein